MNEQLDALLCERYPELFAERHLPMTESPMHWGFVCADGWFDLIDSLCAELQLAVADSRIPQPVARQVKHKWGELRFYTRPYDPLTFSILAGGTARSREICELCGAPGMLMIAECGLGTSRWRGLAQRS